MYSVKNVVASPRFSCEMLRGLLDPQRKKQNLFFTFCFVNESIFFQTQIQLAHLELIFCLLFISIKANFQTINALWNQTVFICSIIEETPIAVL